MGVYKSYKRRFQLKNCNKIRLEKHRNDKIINEINKCLDGMDENQLRTQRKPRRTPLQEVQFGPNIASTLLKQILG